MDSDVCSNVKYFIYPTGYVLAGNVSLPTYITQDKNIVGMTRDPFFRNKQFKDKKSFFRCLAYHRRTEDFFISVLVAWATLLGNLFF